MNPAGALPVPVVIERSLRSNLTELFREARERVFYASKLLGVECDRALVKTYPSELEDFGSLYSLHRMLAAHFAENVFDYQLPLSLTEENSVDFHTSRSWNEWFREQSKRLLAGPYATRAICEAVVSSSPEACEYLLARTRYELGLTIFVPEP